MLTSIKEITMTYDEIFERLPGMTVFDVAVAKGGGLAILFEEGPTILVVGGENETVCVEGGDWEDTWHKVRV